MICKNCSGEYSQDALVCPYCGTENAAAAGRHKAEILQTYDREEKEIRRHAETYAKRTAHKWTKYIVLGTAIALALGVVITVIVIASGKLSVSMAATNRQKHVDKLEAFYEAGEYVQMREYLRDRDLWSREYDKYWKLADIYEEYVRIQEAEAQITDIAASEAMTKEEKVNCSDYWIEDILESGRTLMALCEEYTKDAEFLFNEDALEEIEALCERKFAEYGYSAEEIAGIRQLTTEEELEAYKSVLTAYFLE